MLPPAGASGKNNPAGEPCSTGLGWNHLRILHSGDSLSFSRNTSPIPLFGHLVCWLEQDHHLILWMRKLMLNKEQNAI